MTQLETQFELLKKVRNWKDDRQELSEMIEVKNGFLSFLSNRIKYKNLLKRLLKPNSE